MYLLLKLLSFKFQLMPRKLALFFGRMLGALIYYIVPLRKSVGLKNLSIAFPLLTLRQQSETLRKCYRHFGMVLADFLRLPRLNKKSVNSIITIDNKSMDLLKKHPGGIILTAHLGNWEYILPALGLNGFPMRVVIQVQRDPGSNRFFSELRKSAGVGVIPREAGSKAMLNALQNGYFLGLASDQNAGKRGSTAIFFNSPVSVAKGAAVFYLKTNSPVLVGFCILSKDLNYQLSFQEMDLEGLPENKDDAIVEFNQRYSKILEDNIKNYPQQYFWFHRKWSKSIY